MSDTGRTDPKSPPDFIVYTKIGAAQAQLETALWLWFHYRDSVSVHALAVAANEVYHAIGRDLGLPTIFGKRKAAATPEERRRMNRTQNFAKHARDDPDPLGEDIVSPQWAELMMLDCVIWHEARFSQKTPLMQCFLWRYMAEHPILIDTAIPAEFRALFRKAIEIDKIAKQSRPDYLEYALREIAEDTP